MTSRYEQQQTKILELEEKIQERIEKFGLQDEETKMRISNLELYRRKCERLIQSSKEK